MRIIIFMPFDENFDNTFDVIERAVKSFPQTIHNARPMEPIRIDKVPVIGSIIDSLFKEIKACDCFIADISGLNPNVMLEIGYAYALRKKGIIISRSPIKEDIEYPFDISVDKIISYNEKHIADLEGEIHSSLTQINSLIDLQWTTGADLAFAQAHAYSAADPCYFLDNSYRIRFMNAAAKSFFSLDSNIDWNNSSIDAFSDAICTKIRDMAKSEKEFQRVNFPSSEITPSYRAISTEQMVIRSRFGTAQVLRVGHQVFNVDGDEPIGWVVSYNITKWLDDQNDEGDNWSSSDIFLESHKRFLEQSSGPGSANQKRRRIATLPGFRDLNNELIRRLGSINCIRHDITIAKANSYSKKRGALEFAISAMLDDKQRYGLETVNDLEEDYFDLTKNEYWVARIPTDDYKNDNGDKGIIVAVLRIHHHSPIKESFRSTIRRETYELLRSSRTVDMGAYIHPYFPDGTRKDMLIQLMTRGCPAVESVDYIYGQVKKGKEDGVKRLLGFNVVGEPFTPSGWASVWLPVSVTPSRLRKHCESWSEVEFS